MRAFRSEIRSQQGIKVTDEQTFLQNPSASWAGEGQGPSSSVTDLQLREIAERWEGRRDRHSSLGPPPALPPA